MYKDFYQLLSYAKGIRGDWERVNQIAAWFAPEVPTAVPKFYYKDYGDGNVFQPLQTQRAVGGPSSRTDFTVNDLQGYLETHSAEVTIDDQEREDNPLTIGQIQERKVYNLVTRIMNGYAQKVFALAKLTGVTSGMGAWSGSSTEDPVQEIDNQTKVQLDATGIVPNKLYFDLGAWLKFKSNPAVLKRRPGSSVNFITPAIANQLFAVPMDIRVGGGAKYQSGITDDVFLFASQDAPSTDDASWMKCFTLVSNRFTRLFGYRDERVRSDVYALDWREKLTVTGSALVTRITVT
jgi:hypothetical protein